MNGGELTTLVERCPVTRQFFRGVYAIDTLPTTLQRNSTYICNLDGINEPGSHWIAIYKPPLENEPTEYFDSYGLYAPECLEERLTRNDLDYYLFNKRMIQHFMSVTCGLFALYYIWQRPLRQSMDDALDIFNDDVDFSNDLVVDELVSSHFV